MTDFKPPPFPEHITPQCARFIKNYLTLSNFFNLSALLQSEIPYLLGHMQTDDPEKADSYVSYLAAMHYEDKERFKFKHLVAEIFLTRVIDNFHVYLVDVLRVHYRQAPEQIPQKVKRGKPRQVAGVGKSAPDNVDYFAMITADNLLAEGFIKLMTFLQNDLLLGVGLDEGMVKNIDWAISVRNIIGHNRGRTNDRFIKRTGNEHLPVDLPLIIDPNQANYCINDVFNGILLIDEAFVKKYTMKPFEQFAPYPTLAEGADW